MDRPSKKFVEKMEREVNKSTLLTQEAISQMKRHGELTEKLIKEIKEFNKRRGTYHHTD